MRILMCPVCSADVSLNEKTLKCENNHCFDFAKEGYVNLLLSGKSGDDKGDNKEMARSRRDFLNKGYYYVILQKKTSKRSRMDSWTLLALYKYYLK